MLGLRRVACRAGRCLSHRAIVSPGVSPCSLFSTTSAVNFAATPGTSLLAQQAYPGCKSQHETWWEQSNYPGQRRGAV